MENPKRLIPTRGRAALLATACLLSPLFAGEPANRSGLAQRESAKPDTAIEEAQELLLKGDESYNAGRYGEAVQAYSGARDLLPDAAPSAELRRAATERLAQASVEQGRELSRKGDVAGAKAIVDKVLLPTVSPNDPGALRFRAELDDPIRTNPALDVAHAKKVDEVRKLLYTAEGAYNLGKYDQAESTYEQVLRLDPYNTAARRGMERISVAKADYQQSAKDQTRAEMIAGVGAAWETKIEPLPLNPGMMDPGATTPAPDFIPVANKLPRIIIPKVSLEQASLSEAIDFLRLKVSEANSDLGSINFTINLGDSARVAEINAQRFDLQLSNAPVSEVLKYITEITRTSYTTDEYSVIIRPLGAMTGELITKTYKVPPDFISGLSANASAAPGAAPDPFAAAPSGSQGLLAKRLSAQEALALQGVTFPAGASAAFNAPTSTLRVTNTAANQDIISQIIETTVQGEPVMVAVRVTIIKTEQTNLEELGFDWMLGGVDSGSLHLTGGSVGSGDDLGGFGDLIEDEQIRPVTSGNRSGDTAIGANSIDNLIAMGSERDAVQNRAPGVFQLTGLASGNQVAMLMRGLSQKKGVDLLTNPSTVTRSGQASSVHIIREFIYPTEYEPPEIPDTISSTEIYVNGVYVGSEGGNSFPVTPATPTAFEKRDVGVILEVLPTADANKQYIDVTLNPSVVDFDGFVNYGNPISAPASAGFTGGSTSIEVTPNAILMPVFSVQQAKTNLTVADGATIVIGGLLQESVQNVEDKTPVLGNIPVIGRLFESKAKQPVTTAVVFLVNVQLLDPTGRPYKNR